jgi:hypothetical protein
VASREYSCILRAVRVPFFGAGRVEDAGGPFMIRIDLTSMPSRTNALLNAINRYTDGRMRIGNYALRVHDDDGNLFETIYATEEQIQLHKDGYPASVADGTAPRSLEGFSDEQLIAELQRRLAERAAGSEDSLPA